LCIVLQFFQLSIDYLFLVKIWCFSVFVAALSRYKNTKSLK
jgi:hypothetical protein